MESASECIHKFNKNDFVIDNADVEKPRNTNVILIDFSILSKTKEIIQTGEAISCKTCKAILNSNSKVLLKEESSQKIEINLENDAIMEETKEEVKNEDSEGKIEGSSVTKADLREWKCEFCGSLNMITVEPEALPTSNDTIYLIQKANPQTTTDVTKDTTNATENVNNEDETSLIICLDNSGSMDMKTTIRSEDNRHLTRKEALMVALKSVLLDLAKTHPFVKLGIVIFDDIVTLIGDGVVGQRKISCISDYEAIKKNAEVSAGDILNKPISETCEKLMDFCSQIKTNGSTALGPGLLSSIALASNGKSGSRVIICTDGLANRGVGSVHYISETNSAKQFYLQVSNYAKAKNVSVSVMTLKGQDCNVELLGQVADATNGNVTRVDAGDLGENFARIIHDEIVATNVELTVLLHKGLKFRNESGSSLLEGGSKCVKIVGNATKNTQTTLEYDYKSLTELENERVSLEGVNEMPMQSQIYFSDREGNKYVRVITKVQQVTESKEEIEKGANIAILATNSVQKSAKLALEGKLDEALKVSSGWQNYIVNSVGSQANAPSSQREVDLFQKQNAALIGNIESQKTNQSLSKKDDASTFMFNMKKVNAQSFKDNEQKQDKN